MEQDVATDGTTNARRKGGESNAENDKIAASDKDQGWEQSRAGIVAAVKQIESARSADGECQ